MDVGELVVRLRGDSSGLNTALDKSVKAIDTLKVKSDQTQRLVNTHFSSMAAGAKNMGAALGVGFGVAALVNFTRSVIDTNDRLSDLADQTGFAAGTLSGLRTTIENAGVSIDGFAQSIRFAQRNLGQTNEESDKAAVALKAMGLSFEEMKTASPEEFFRKVAIGVSQFGDENSRGALLAATLGRQAAQLAGVIAILGRDFNKLKDSGLSTETVNKLGAIADGFHSLGNRIKDLAAGPLLAIIDTLNHFMGAVTPEQKTFEKLIELKQRIKDINDQIEVNKNGSFLEKFFSVSPADVFKPDLGALSGQSNTLEAQRAKLQAEVDKIRNATKAAAASSGGTKTFTPPDTKMLDAIKSVTEALNKELIAVQGEQMALDLGESAARRWVSAHDAMNQLGLKKLPPSIQIIIDKLHDAKDILVEFAKEATRMDVLRKAFVDMADAVKQIDLASLSEGARQLADLQAPLDELKIKLIVLEAELNETGNLSQNAAEKIQKAFDQISFAKFQNNLKAASDSFGPTGMDILDKSQGQDIAANIDKTQKLQQSLSDLADEQQHIADMSKVLGGSYDAVSASIQNQQQRVEALTRLYGAFDERVTKAADDLKEMQKAADMMNAVEGVISNASQTIGDNLMAIAEGTKTVAQGFKAMATSIMKSISDVIWKTLVVEPMKQAFKDAVSAGTGGIGGMDLGVLFGGLLGRKTDKSGAQAKGGWTEDLNDLKRGSADASNAAAAGSGADAVSAAATATIQAEAAVATSAIQAQSVEASAEIQGLVSIGMSAIDNVAAVAISAIQDIAAQNQAASSSQGSSFGLFGDAINATGSPSGTESGLDTGAYSMGGGLTTSMGYARGGTVPGREGKPQWAIVHGGEEIIPVGGRGKSGGGNIIVNINTPDAQSFHASRHQVASEMHAALLRQQNR